MLVCHSQDNFEIVRSCFLPVVHQALRSDQVVNRQACTARDPELTVSKLILDPL